MGASRATAPARLCERPHVLVGVLDEVKVGREKLFINPRLMRLLTTERPGDLVFGARSQNQSLAHARRA